MVLESPIWKITDEGKEIYQGVNSDPSVAVGDTRFSNVDYEGTFFVHNNSGDNDWVGVVFSFQVNLYFVRGSLHFILHFSLTAPPPSVKKFDVFFTESRPLVLSPQRLKTLSKIFKSKNFIKC